MYYHYYGIHEHMRQGNVSQVHIAHRGDGNPFVRVVVVFVLGILLVVPNMALDHVTMILSLEVLAEHVFVIVVIACLVHDKE